MKGKDQDEAKPLTAVEMQRGVMCEISDREMQKLDMKTPIFWQIRCKLNEAGFKFKDDGKLSACINKNPEPLGVLVRWYDVAKGITYFKQTLST